MNLSTWHYSKQSLDLWIEHDIHLSILRKLPVKLRPLSEIIIRLFIGMAIGMAIPIPFSLAVTILKKQTASPLMQLIAKTTFVAYAVACFIPIALLYTDHRWKKFQNEADQIVKTGDVNQIIPYLQKKGKYLASLDLSSPGFSPGLSDQDLQEIVNHCPNLRKINLNHSKITDQGLSHLSALHLLEHLEVEGCLITDAAILSLGPLTLKRLKSLNLKDCTLLTDATLTHLKPSSHLQSLNLQNCKNISDVGIEYLQFCTSLQDLNLTDCNQITDKSLEYLKHLEFMEKLKLDGCLLLTGKTFSHLSNLPLRSLSLNALQIDDQSIAHLTANSSLKTLNLRNCSKLTNVSLALLPEKLQTLDISLCRNITDDGIAFLKRYSKLEYLGMSSRSFSDASIEHVKSLSHLISLDLQSCSITDQGISQLKNLSKIKFLNLGGGTPITDTTMPYILNLKNLTRLSLWWCDNITNASFQQLKCLSKLQSLGLRGCKSLSDAGLNHLQSHPSLSEVNIQDCPLLTQQGIADFQQSFKGKIIA